jgi:hypothetical protein
VFQCRGCWEFHPNSMHGILFLPFWICETLSSWPTTNGTPLTSFPLSPRQRLLCPPWPNTPHCIFSALVTCWLQDCKTCISVCFLLGLTQTTHDQNIDCMTHGRTAFLWVLKKESLLSFSGFWGLPASHALTTLTSASIATFLQWFLFPIRGIVMVVLDYTIV